MKRKKETKNRYLIKIVFLLIISGTIICIELEMLNKMNIENQKQYSTQKLITSQDEEENKLLEDNITSNNTQNLLEESNEENSFLENDNNEKNTLKDKGLNNENLNNKSLNNKNLNNENDGEVLQNYKGYSVCAKLEIPKINLETYVLSDFSENALKISVTKFWGVNPNEVGNFCIAGHNFSNKNMFHNLKKLQVGDTFSIRDNKNGKFEYNIYSVYKVVPKNVSCLKQNTDGKREVTLITCTSDSSQRIIVKAKQKDENI